MPSYPSSGESKGRRELHTLERMDSDPNWIIFRLLLNDSYFWKVDLSFGKPVQSHNRYKSD